MNMTLKTDYKDEILDVTKNVKKKYNLIQNDDGTVSLEDVTSYSQTGDMFGAKDINSTNAEIEKLKSMGIESIKIFPIWINNFMNSATLFGIITDKTFIEMYQESYLFISPIVDSTGGAELKSVNIDSGMLIGMNDRFQINANATNKDFVEGDSIKVNLMLIKPLSE